MKGKYSSKDLRPGCTYHLFHQKYHYVGVLKDGDESIFTFWFYNSYRRRRFYRTMPEWETDIELKYVEKIHYAND